MGAFLPKLGLAAIAALAIAGTANAAVTITYAGGAANLPVPAGQTLVDDFSGSPVLAGYTFTGGSVVTGSVAGANTAPTGDLTAYLAVTGGNVATLTTPNQVTKLSLYIGTIDTFNTISFFNTGNGLVDSFTGTQLMAIAGPAISGTSTDDGRFTFDLTGLNVAKVTFGSTSNSFEFDNIAASVPEPGVWAMMLVGMGGLGYALRRRRFAIGASAATA